MGQTLTHGVYLPDEGERNCYSGLAANWSILDGAVGTIAEHASALAGKAPLVHTHTKSDVTDLLNSNFIPSVNNSYDLGSSSYQWNNLYAKNYYYDGTAWGLDKANVWSAENTYTNSIALKQTNLEKGELPASGQTRRYRFPDKNNSDLGWLQHRVSTSGDSYLELRLANKFSNGQLSTQGNEIANSIAIGLHSDGSRYLTVLGDVFPDLPTRVCNLGTSTNKWKTLNGVNPGALSLPDYTQYEPINFSQWDVTGAVGVNFYTPTVNGWLNISIWDRATNSIFVYRSGKERVGVFGNGSMASDGRIALLMPVQANATYSIIIKASANSDIYSAIFFPCLGNV